MFCAISWGARAGSSREPAFENSGGMLMGRFEEVGRIWQLVGNQLGVTAVV